MAAQAAARPGAPPGASALIASAAIAIVARCSARWPLSRRIAARLPGPKMAARLARWPHPGCTRTAGEMAARLSRCCETALRLRGCAARLRLRVSAAFGAALIRDSTIAGTATTASGNALQRGVGVVEGTE